MKTKTFLLLCLFFGIGLTPLFGQQVQVISHLNDKGTGTVIYIGSEIPWGTPVMCDGQQVDILVGTINSHQVISFKNGVLKGANERYVGGDFRSINPNSTEVFKFMEKDHAMDLYFVEVDGDPQLCGTDTFHFNIIGNEGSHYEGIGVLDIQTQSVTIIKANCPGNKN
jgi:hypothetical protein